MSRIKKHFSTENLDALFDFNMLYKVIIKGLATGIIAQLWHCSCRGFWICPMTVKLKEPIKDNDFVESCLYTLGR